MSRKACAGVVAVAMLVGGVRYWLRWTPFSVQPWLGAGYRAVVFDRDFGAGDSLDLQFRGPLGGMGFVF